MAVPDFQSIMLPFLELASDSLEHTMQETHEKLAIKFGLTEKDLNEMIPSGFSTIWKNRVSWAKVHLAKAKLIETPRRSVYKISKRGIELLNKKPPVVNLALLKQFPDYLPFQKNTLIDSTPEILSHNNNETSTPAETLSFAYQTLRKNLAQDILEKIRAISPYKFEELVLKLLLKMGYGGSLKDAAQTTKKSNDEGIDGIIKEDRLGLDVIYIQAKRWKSENKIGREDIQKFVGVLATKGVRKGIFITTSSFGKNALDALPKNETKIVLIDGEQLAQYMIDYNLGVSVAEVFEVKKLDNDFFEEE